LVRLLWARESDSLWGVAKVGVWGELSVFPWVVPWLVVQTWDEV
jgi:hypothetical protein